MTHCAKCKVRMPQGSLVQRIFDCVFHLDCFTCARCNWRLQFGEYVAFAKGEVFCAWHLRPLPPPASVQPQSELPETSWSDPGRTNVDSIENPLIEEFFDGGSFIRKVSSKVMDIKVMPFSNNSDPPRDPPPLAAVPNSDLSEFVPASLHNRLQCCRPASKRCRILTDRNWNVLLKPPL